MPATVIHLTLHDGPRTLEVLPQEGAFVLDGVRHRFCSRALAHVVAVVAAATPKIVPYDALFQEVATKAAVGSRVNHRALLHKWACQATKALVGAGLKTELFENYRNHGYGLAQGWARTVIPTKRQLAQVELASIRAVADACIEHVRAQPIVALPTPVLSHVRFDPSMALNNFVIVNRAMWQVFNTLSSEDVITDALALKDDFDALLNYVIFSRLGHRTSDADWRRDYESELRTIVRDIEMRIDRISGILDQGNALHRAAL